MNDVLWEHVTTKAFSMSSSWCYSLSILPMQRSVLVMPFGSIYSDICIGYIHVLLLPGVLLCFFYFFCRLRMREKAIYLVERFASLHSLYRDGFYPDLEIQVEPETDREVSFLFRSIFSFPILAWSGGWSPSYNQNDGFSGQPGERISNLSNVVSTHLSNHRFSGALPDVFRAFQSLRSFLPDQIIFSDQLPPSLMCSLSLSTVDLNSKTVSTVLQWHIQVPSTLVPIFSPGLLPEKFCACHGLHVLNLANNHLGEAIASGFQDLQTLTHHYLSQERK